MSDFADDALLAELIAAKEGNPNLADLLQGAIDEIERLDRLALGYAEAMQYDERP